MRLEKVFIEVYIDNQSVFVIVYYDEMDLPEFHSTHELLFTVYVKHSNFWSSVTITPMCNDLVHEMIWQCKFALSKCILRSKP